MTSTQMATALSRRQLARPSSALAEMVLLNEILNTLSLGDPLHTKIATLLGAESDNLANDTWNQHYDAVLVDVRRRII
jgi:hypothetical protein